MNVNHESNPGPTSNTIKLLGSDGDSMFICQAEEELNLVEFETDESDYVDASGFAVDIQNVAASFIGEHDCIFDEVPSGLQTERLKLIVTADANTLTQVTENTEFKAQLIVARASVDNHQINDDIYINCPKSGNNIPKRSFN